jgi:ribosome-binding ATPase YchF (GTP1/OBG family)
VQPNIGVVKVPDDRLDRLAKLFNPKKFTLADIRYIDFPGEAFSDGQGPPPQFLAQLARCDALIHVVRAFADETVPHPQVSIDPARDAAAMELELAFADAAFIESAWSGRAQGVAWPASVTPPSARSRCSPASSRASKPRSPSATSR